METRKRSRRSAKAAGRSFEDDLVRALNVYGLEAHRLRMKGSKDEGDVRAELAADHVFEAKNCRTLALTQWWRETIKERDNAKARYGWIVHKRHGVSDPSEQWATTTTGQLAELLAELAHLRVLLAELEPSKSDTGNTETSTDSVNGRRQDPLDAADEHPHAGFS